MINNRQRISGILKPYRRMAGWLANRMPKALFTRALIIIIAPMVLLQSVVAYVFMERHWQLVTKRLSSAVVRDIGSVIDVMELSKHHELANDMVRIAADRMGSRT